MKKPVLFLLIAILSLPVATFSTFAQLRKFKKYSAKQKAKRLKLAPDLIELLTQDDEVERSGQNRALQRLQRMAHTPRPVFSGGTLPATETPAGVAQSFIVQLEATTPEIVLQEKLALLGGRVVRKYNQMGLVKIEAPRKAIRSIAADNNVAYVSPDRVTKSHGHVDTTTGAATASISTSTTSCLLGLLCSTSTTTTALDGTGVGIAILDSGMDEDHKSFTNKDGRRRVTEIDYGNDELAPDKDDKFGHGTHVAALAAASTEQQDYPSRVRGRYNGVAKNAYLYNLRVLNEEGLGKTSWMLEALDWIYNNRNKVSPKIRVVNLSLGTPAVDSYKNDPLCLAARRLVDAGIVVVAAAGNDGKDSNGNKVYGLIHSPGNDPSVITVGASNTFGTDGRTDDVVTTYSSRGPTRSYWTDEQGFKHYDNLLKPDLVAPGNKLIAARSELTASHLAKLHPELAAYDNGEAKLAQMSLSGTSMATPIVAGAVAILLQANPKLTPNLVKAILMYTAQSLPNYNHFEQGAGQLNVDGAARVARLVRTNLSGALGESLLTTSSPPNPQTTIADETFTWSQGIVLGQTYATGTELITRYQKVYGTGMLLSDGILMGDGILMADSTKLTRGITLGENILTSSGMLMSDGTPFLTVDQMLGDGMLLSDGILMGDGILMSDGMLMSDGILMSDGMLMSDYFKSQNTRLWGDNTDSMK